MNINQHFLPCCFSYQPESRSCLSSFGGSKALKAQVLGKPDVFVRCALARPFPKNWPNKTAKLQLKASKIDNLRNKLVHGAGNLETKGGNRTVKDILKPPFASWGWKLAVEASPKKGMKIDTIPYFWVPCSVVSRRDFLASPFSPWDVLGFSCYVSWIWSSTEESIKDFGVRCCHPAESATFPESSCSIEMMHHATVNAAKTII